MYMNDELIMMSIIESIKNNGKYNIKNKYFSMKYETISSDCLKDNIRVSFFPDIKDV